MSEESGTADQLRAYVARLDRIETEIDGLGEAKRALYKEIRACGFDKEAIRRMVVRKRDERRGRAADDSTLEKYEASVATGSDPFD